jgi:Sulfotransferase domain
MAPSLEVIGLGLCRTGTMSVKAALNTLGKGPCYHMSEAANTPHTNTWLELMAARERGQTERTHELLGKVLGMDKAGEPMQCAVVAACLRSEQLVQHYCLRARTYCLICSHVPARWRHASVAVLSPSTGRAGRQIGVPSIEITRMHRAPAVQAEALGAGIYKTTY